MKSNELNLELVKYAETEIFPIYETFDKGHDLNHIISVINRAMNIYNGIDGLNINIVYISAVLHDIGIKVQRKNHAYYSGVFIENNEKLREFFSNDEIIIIKEAVEDHSTSIGREPRSIYGKIVCDADKDDDMEVALLRAYEFTKAYYPDYTEEECFNNVFEQLNYKFGENGMVKFWINTEKQKEFLKCMRRLALNEEKFSSTLRALVNRNNQNQEKKKILKNV